MVRRNNGRSNAPQAIEPNCAGHAARAGPTIDGNGYGDVEDVEDRWRRPSLIQKLNRGPGLAVSRIEGC